MGKNRKNILIDMRAALCMVLLCMAMFILLSSFWIYHYYGELSAAMTNEFFLNFLCNKRRLFFRDIIVPTILFLLILFVIQYMMHRKGKRIKNKIKLLISFGLLILSIVVASMRLNANPYFSRLYRLHKAQWYDHNRVIVHALGEIESITYTNSKEALENSYQAGVRFLECDFSITSDGQLVACHDWEFWNSWYPDDEENVGSGYVPDLDEFMSTKVMGQFTALSGEDLILFMKEHPDVYIITDTKDVEPETLCDPFKALIWLAEKNDCDEVLERFIIQIYHTYMYDMIEEVYSFPNYIYTLYQEGYRGEEDKMENYAEFCMYHDIDVIVMRDTYYHDELLDIAKRYGLQIFVHTVNDENKMQVYLENGVGIYTDKADLLYE